MKNFNIFEEALQKITIKLSELKNSKDIENTIHYIKFIVDKAIYDSKNADAD